jgi:hypothetical protein
VAGDGLDLHGRLLEEKIVVDIIEGGEWHNLFHEGLQVVVAGAQTMQEV